MSEAAATAAVPEPPPSPPPAELVRGVGLLQATSTNMLNMIGIGPFITVHLILSAMNGPHALLGWILGALISICDGLVWAELGAAMPGTGGPYVYLRQAYGPERLGRLMSFLYIWQVVLTAPLGIASGAVGFHDYAQYLFTDLPAWQVRLVAVGLCLGVTAILYRDITSIGRLSVGLLAIVIATTAWIIVSGLAHMEPARLTDVPPGAFTFGAGFFSGLGSATLLAMYSYGGYFNVCLFGGEVKDPGRTIPRSILLAIVVVAVIYVLLSVAIVGVVPWREAATSEFVVSIFMERIYGRWAGVLVTLLILLASFGSVFAIMLGTSRVPYAAAAEGRFFRVFARLHPTKRFPHVSLLYIGVASAAACWLSLAQIIGALMVVQIVIQFMAQTVAVVLVRRTRPDLVLPFRMWLYPAPAAIAFAGWAYILFTSKRSIVGIALAFVAFGVTAYLIRARRTGEWPFAAAAARS